MIIRSMYFRNDEELQAVKEFIKSLRTGTPIKVLQQGKFHQGQFTAYTMQDDAPMPNAAVSGQELKPIPQAFDVKPNMTIPLLPEWEQYQQYPWVFTQARDALVRDYPGAQVDLEIIKRYVEDRLKLID